MKMQLYLAQNIIVYGDSSLLKWRPPWCMVFDPCGV